MRVVVVGGGAAGSTAAIRARRLGAEVTLLARNRLGAG
jgi:flavin-dependent dehydrogenase